VDNFLKLVDNSKSLDISGSLGIILTHFIISYSQFLELSCNNGFLKIAAPDYGQACLTFGQFYHIGEALALARRSNVATKQSPVISLRLDKPKIGVSGGKAPDLFC